MSLYKKRCLTYLIAPISMTLLCACSTVSKDWIVSEAAAKHLSTIKLVGAADPRPYSRSVLFSPKTVNSKLNLAGDHQEILLSTRALLSKEQDIFRNGLGCVDSDCETKALASRNDWRIVFKTETSSIVDIAYSQVEDRSVYAIDSEGGTWFKTDVSRLDREWSKLSHLSLESDEKVLGVVVRKYAFARGVSFQKLSFKKNGDTLWGFTQYNIYRSENSKSIGVWRKLPFNEAKTNRINDLIEIASSQGLKLLLATDNGIFSSFDGGDSWRRLDSDENNKRFKRLFYRSPYIYALTQNSSLRLHQAALPD